MQTLVLILGGMADVENIKGTVDRSLRFAAEGIAETRQADEKVAAYGRLLFGIRNACGQYLAEMEDWKEVESVLPIAPLDQAISEVTPLMSDNPLVLTAVMSFEYAFALAHAEDDKLFGDAFEQLKGLLHQVQQAAENLGGASLSTRNALTDVSGSSVTGYTQAGIENLLDYRNML